MTGTLQRFVRRWWAGAYGLPGAFLRLLLTPLSWVWAFEARRRGERTAATVVAGVRVVSIGNLAVGGTGKTPLASWVVRVLAAGGARAALLLRGYGRDEVLLHRHWTPQVPVVVDADRVGGARRAAAGGADTVVLDDGFQHRRLARDLDLVLLSADDPFPAPVLPCGPYREPAAALARADAIVLTRRVASVGAAETLAAAVTALPGIRAGAVVASVRLGPGDLVPFEVWSDGQISERGDHGSTSPEPACKASRGAVALTAIARPDTLVPALETLLDSHVELMAFPDHHDFSASDARKARSRAGDRPVVVTEKDAVKLVEHADLLGETWVLRQRLAWDWGEEDLRALVVGGGA